MRTKEAWFIAISSPPEFLLRGYATPSKGATKIKAKANLKFIVASGERREELADIDITPGNKFTIGPLTVETLSLQQYQGSPVNSVRFSNRISQGGSGIDWDAVDLVAKTQGSQKVVKSFQWFDESGKLVKKFDPVALSKPTGFLLDDIDAKRVKVTIDYYDRSTKVVTNLELETGIGF